MYAIPEKDLRSKRAKQIVISESESDDDFQQPVRKRFASSPEGSTCSSKVLSEVKHICKDIKSLFQISGHMKIHLAYIGIFTTHFNAISAVHRPSPLPPVIFARCRKRLLGCQTCVDGWYQGEEGMACSCPLCWSERAYADTTPIKGMDEFLRAIVPLLGSNDNTGHGDPSDDDDGMPSITLHGLTGSSYQLLHHFSTQLF